MAVARPVRALGVAAVLMWCFFLYQIFKPAATLRPNLNTEREPNQDRTCGLVRCSSPSYARRALSNRFFARSFRRTQGSAGTHIRQVQAGHRGLGAHQRHPAGARAQRGARGHAPGHARSGADVEPQVQLPLDLFQRRAVQRGVQEEDTSRDQGRVPIRYVGVPGVAPASMRSKVV